MWLLFRLDPIAACCTYSKGIAKDVPHCLHKQYQAIRSKASMMLLNILTQSNLEVKLRDYLFQKTTGLKPPATTDPDDLSQNDPKKMENGTKCPFAKLPRSLPVSRSPAEIFFIAISRRGKQG
jgi:hypothetical protein